MALDYTVHRRLRQICSNKKNRRLAIHIEDAPEAFDCPVLRSSAIDGGKT